MKIRNKESSTKRNPFSGVSFFTQSDFVCRHAASFVFQRGIMLFRRIDVLMPEYVGHKVDIAGFTVEGGAVSASQLVGRDFFQTRYGRRVFFYHIFHRTDTDPAVLHG